jgi:hypothetical protein
VAGFRVAYAASRLRSADGQAKTGIMRFDLEGLSTARLRN